MAARTVRDREVPGSNPGPPTKSQFLGSRRFVLKLGRGNPVRLPRRPLNQRGLGEEAAQEFGHPLRRLLIWGEKVPSRSSVAKRVQPTRHLCSFNRTVIWDFYQCAVVVQDLSETNS